MLIACTQRGDESGHVGMPLQTPSEKEQPINLAAGSEVSLRPALSFPLCCPLSSSVQPSSCSRETANPGPPP